jgi:thiol:disulfide interchange protein DsbD
MLGFTDLLNQWNYQLGRLFDELAAGSVLAVLVVFAAGVVTSFTPCVYPVIPVTVTYLGGAAGGNKRRAVTLSLTYVAGLAVVYTSLGVTAALLGKTFGLFTRSPWIFGAVGLLIVFFGLGMLDIYAIRVPAFLSGVQAKGAQRGGYVGALLMGVAAAFVTAPCAAPVLGSLLAVVGRSQKVVWGSFLLLVFALGLSTLLLALGIFSGMVSSMPKPGRWMDWIKKGFGVAMILVGGWFVYQAVMMALHRGGAG